MKKFILFSFLMTTLFCRVYAQDNFGDEFSDPSLQNFPAPELQPAESQPAQNPMPQEENFTLTPSAETPSTSQEPIEAFAQPQVALNQEGGSQDVILEVQSDLTKSYKERRGRHGVLFSIDYEKFYPTDYYSQFRDFYIEDIIGSDQINLIGGELGYKFNFQLGSLAILGNYALGSIEGSVTNSNVTTKRSIDLTRYGLSLNFALDNFMQEPWIVPYAQVGAHQFQVTEYDESKDESLSTTTQVSLNYRFGLLFQLNWIEKSIDPTTQLEGLKSSGLQNTFLDIYVVDHLASANVYDSTNANSEGDPDLASSLELGIGLKMEF